MWRLGDRVLGLIAGDGEFPVEIARAARAQGQRVHAIGFPDITAPRLETLVDRLDWIRLGCLQELIDCLHDAQVADVVMAGKVSKAHLIRPGAAVFPDARALCLISSLPDREDSSLLGAVADLLSGEGFSLQAQTELVPELLARVGRVAGPPLAAAHHADLEYGFERARAFARLDVGQCILVEGGCVLAVEAVEGTDATIARGGALSGGGAVCIKVARPHQDLRFDLPAIGVDTLEALARARVRVLAVEADRTVVLGRAGFERRARELDISVTAVAVPVSGLEA